jgi:5-methylcytosine-specific restriction endonuclease McrA
LGKWNETYCSDACIKAANCEKSRITNASKKVIVSRRCKRCGKEFVAEYGDKRESYCSAKCGNAMARKPHRKIYNQRRRAKLRALPRTFKLSQWRLSLEYFGGNCAYCGRPSDKPLHQDHVIALSKGGGYTADNIVPACFDCNVDKGSKDFTLWYLGYEHASLDRLMRIEWYISQYKSTTYRGTIHCCQLPSQDRRAVSRVKNLREMD